VEKHNTFVGELEALIAGQLNMFVCITKELVGDQLACYPKKSTDIIKMEAACSIGTISSAGDSASTRTTALLVKEPLQVLDEYPFEFESWNYVMHVLDETEG
jgi:hypothetical protein